MTECEDTAPHPGGRPTKYKPEYAEQAAKLCALGATDTDLADFFGVCVNTIGNWRTAHEEFLGAIKNAKDIADDRVERSLYQRAVGYQVEAVKIFMPANADKPVYAPFRENVLPDVTAAIFWLKNRRKAEWMDVNRQERTGPDGGPVEHKHTGLNEVLSRIARLSARTAESDDPQGSQ